MKTFENLQAEVVKLGERAKDISNKIDLKESYRGVKSFDADLVMNELNRLATFHETLSVKHYEYSKQNLNNSANSWAESADGHYHAAKEVRETITFLVRTQKQRQ